MEVNNSAILPLIILLPLLGGIVNGLFGKHFSRQVSYFIGSTTVLASFLLSVQVFLSLRGLGAAHAEQALRFTLFQWISGGSYSFDFAFLADPLSSMMLLVVTGVGFLVHLYSTSYMDDDPGYARYFSYLNLFVFSMLVLVLGKNLAMLFIGWEGVGACSYLLIGFWFKDMEKAEAGQKAFVVNRIGDIGFLIAMFLLLAYAGGSLDYDSLRTHFSDSIHAVDHPPTITLICLLLFVGACGKSAQIPLYVWLPDAMAGPTPVSALIHAATMVTAGVYMIARLNFIFALSPVAMTVNPANAGSLLARLQLARGACDAVETALKAFADTEAWRADQLWLGAKGFTKDSLYGEMRAWRRLRGFIRAEVVAYEDLLALRSTAEARKPGRLRSEGKTYTVHDGDVIEILFSK